MWTQVQHCESTLAGMPVGGYGKPLPQMATTFKVTRLPAASKPRRAKTMNCAGFTTIIRAGRKVTVYA